MPSIIEAALAEPYACAIHLLRAVDPLYQSEIGVEREWELDVEINSHGCDCCYCVESKTAIVEAVTAAEAIEIYERDKAKGEFVMGVRVKGSRGPFADADQVLS